MSASDHLLIFMCGQRGDKVICFLRDLHRVNGRTLDPVCRRPGDPTAVPDELLRWHFRQAVCINMRGAGEPIFQMDFPPGSDMIEEIRCGPNPQLQMELELFSRLPPAYDAS